MDKDSLVGQVIAEVGATAQRDGLVRPGDSRWDPATNTLHVEVGDGDDRPDDDASAIPDRWRERREAGLVWDADPDERVYTPGYDLIAVGERGTIRERTVTLPYVESPWLARIGATLIERDDATLGALDRWGIRIAYLWADDLGTVDGAARLWRLKKPPAEAVWALGQSRDTSGERRVVDLLLLVNARVVRYAQMTNWQLQATLHTALSHARVKQGKVAIEPTSDFVQQRLLRRYGNWQPSLRALAEVLRLAEADQLPLWPEDEEGSDGE